MTDKRFRKITVTSCETDYCYCEITDYRNVDDVRFEHQRRDWDVEYLDFQEQILTPQELTFELLKNNNHFKTTPRIRRLV